MKTFWQAGAVAFIIGFPVLAVFICEFSIYFFTLSRNCSWPQNVEKDKDPLFVAIIADPHLIGKKGHWFDRLRREWQMKMSFRATITIFSPDLVVLLGDSLDRGHKYSDSEIWYEKDLSRFINLFGSVNNSATIILVGNHDIGFHSSIRRSRIDRWRDVFGPSTDLLSFADSKYFFVKLDSINSRNFANASICRNKEDSISCTCNQTKAELDACVEILKEQAGKAKQVILLTHFPLFRENERECTKIDITKEIVAEYGEFSLRKNWIDGQFDYSNLEEKDVMGKVQTEFLLRTIQPTFVFSGHTHYFCEYTHRLPNGRGDVKEVTVSTFNWRNRVDPSFVLAVISSNKVEYGVCYLPRESDVAKLYILFLVFYISILMWMFVAMLSRCKRVSQFTLNIKRK
eukprot:TRINITY_DN17725_c0_g1_i1.p1 TRINITY_DN17725_c0_g1~~TRINITY_DN17725_c0_g1_i1.p1  ORF type:complete len:401 (-),score=38.72 TRINITY_DN17725_c0_g1_i1:25-1227(-)